MVTPRERGIGGGGSLAPVVPAKNRFLSLKLFQKCFFHCLITFGTPFSPTGEGGGLCFGPVADGFQPCSPFPLGRIKNKFDLRSHCIIVKIHQRNWTPEFDQVIGSLRLTCSAIPRFFCFKCHMLVVTTPPRCCTQTYRSLGRFLNMGHKWKNPFIVVVHRLIESPLLTQGPPKIPHHPSLDHLGALA